MNQILEQLQTADKIVKLAWPYFENAESIRQRAAKKANEYMAAYRSIGLKIAIVFVCYLFSIWLFGRTNLGAMIGIIVAVAFSFWMKKTAFLFLWKTPMPMPTIHPLFAIPMPCIFSSTGIQRRKSGECSYLRTACLNLLPAKKIFLNITG